MGISLEVDVYIPVRRPKKLSIFMKFRPHLFDSYQPLSLLAAVLGCYGETVILVLPITVEIDGKKMKRATKLQGIVFNFYNKRIII